MDDEEVRDLVSRARATFGTKCAKFAGAITVEIIKRALENHGIRTSARDVFIKGLPIEIDLLVPRKGASPEHGLLYQPQDVLVVFEIKNSGSFGQKTIDRVKDNFQRTQRLDESIYCAYVALAELERYKWAVSEGNAGFPTYTLFWHDRSRKRYTPSGDWNRLLAKVTDIVQRDSSAATPALLDVTPRLTRHKP
jgi:hypothetical protein